MPAGLLHQLKHLVMMLLVHAFRMQLEMVTLQGAFVDYVGVSEALLQLLEHMKLNPLLCGWVSPMLEPESGGPASWETEELNI